MDERLLQSKILIVDDAPDAVQLMEVILRTAGYQHVRGTTDPHQARPIFQEWQPDLLLLDLMMPELDGFHVMAQLQELISDDNYLPILILTADIHPESKQRALQRGAIDFLNKPYDTVEVLLRIRNLLQMRFFYLDLQRQNRELEAQNQQLAEKVTEIAQSRSETECALESLRLSQQQLQALSHRLIEAQEAERRFVAQELHDEIGQALTAVKINLQALREANGFTSPAPIEDSIRITDRALHQVRGLSLDLRPAMLDDFGLIDTLLWYVERLAQTANMDVQFHFDPLPERLPPVLETTCYRVAQEALTNVMRHAQAQHVEVELRVMPAELHLIVRDDGRGFDVNAARERLARRSSLGLATMSERVEVAGGRLELESSPQHGTTVHAYLPRIAFAPLSPTNLQDEI